MSATSKAVQAFSITTSLIASGGIATLSLFDIPEFMSQSASNSLPMTRWLFSRGSHIFPQAAILSGSGFAYLAYKSLPIASRTVLQLFKFAKNSGRVNGYLAAAALAISIGPFTSFAMIPTNFALIKLNEDLGGARSQRSARERGADYKAGSTSADESVAGKGAANQFTDLSGPQQRTEKTASPEQEKRVQELLAKFRDLNYVRAVLLAGGGIIGLLTALGV